MVINQYLLLERAPIKDMLRQKVTHNGVSHGLSEVGYDIRLKQTICFVPSCLGFGYVKREEPNGECVQEDGNFIIGSAIEEFQMPDNLMGIVHDKSTWARKGLSVFNTVIEPGFRGGLTLELVYNGQESLLLEAGTGIAQVIFHDVQVPCQYAGKYQDQSLNPEPARFA